MKPVVLIKETNKDGKIELTEEELKQLITDAYEQGYEDGKKQNQVPIYIPPISSNPPGNWWDQIVYCGPTPGTTESHTIPNQNVTLRG